MQFPIFARFLNCTKASIQTRFTQICVLDVVICFIDISCSVEHLFPWIEYLVLRYRSLYQVINLFVKPSTFPGPIWNKSLTCKKLNILSTEFPDKLWFWKAIELFANFGFYWSELFSFIIPKEATEFTSIARNTEQASGYLSSSEDFPKIMEKFSQLI